MTLFLSKEMDYIGLISIDSKHSCGFTLYLKYIINHSFQKFPRHKFIIEILSPTHESQFLGDHTFCEKGYKLVIKAYPYHPR